jgi:hypothetical protein
MVLATTLGLLAFCLNVGGLLGLLPISLYLFTVLLAAIANKESLATKLSLFIALPAMHFSWGLGFITGLLYKR